MNPGHDKWGKKNRIASLHQMENTYCATFLSPFFGSLLFPQLLTYSRALQRARDPLEVG